MASLIVVSYDIPSDRRRGRLANLLKDYGVRVQYSVFECRLEVGQLERLRKSLTREVKSSEDSIRLYRFCQDCGTKLEIFGIDRPAEEPDVYIL